MKLNKEFISECNKRLEEKESKYGGEDNPKNYKNMTIYELLELIHEDVMLLYKFLFIGGKENIKRLCVDIANRAAMIWEKNCNKREKIMGKYIRKPVVVEAFKWTGGHDQEEDPEWLIKAIKEGKVYFACYNNEPVNMKIKTLEGIMTANMGDWIIKGINNEIYPCKPYIFEKTYEELKEEL